MEPNTTELLHTLIAFRHGHPVPTTSHGLEQLKTAILVLSLETAEPQIGVAVSEGAAVLQLHLNILTPRRRLKDTLSAVPANPEDPSSVSFVPLAAVSPTLQRGRLPLHFRVHVAVMCLWPEEGNVLYNRRPWAFHLHRYCN